MKANRHYKAKIICSSQYLNDCVPAQHKNFDVHLVFGGFSENKLTEIHRHVDMSIEYEKFVDLYHDATHQRYSFFYMNPTH